MQFESKFNTLWKENDTVDIIKTGAWRSQQPVTKIGKCVQCGWCYLFCPTGCISNKDTYFAANLDYCKGCGICAKVCPVNAIKMVLGA